MGELRKFLKEVTTARSGPNKLWAELTDLGDDGWKIQLSDNGPIAKFTNAVYGEINHEGDQNRLEVEIGFNKPDTVTFFYK